MAVTLRKKHPKRHKIHHKADRPLVRFALNFFRHPRRTALLALAIALFGILSFTTLLKREGFPSIDIPYAIAQGTYFVNDPAKVDRDVAKPLNAYLLKQSNIKTVQTTSLGNFFTVVVQYDEGTNAEAASRAIEQQVATQNIIPEVASLKIETAKFGFTERGDDAVLSLVYVGESSKSAADLVAPAKEAESFLRSKQMSLVESLGVISQFQEAKDPTTGKTEPTQTSFERYGERENGTTRFYNSIAIGVKSKAGSDVIQYDKQLQEAVDSYNLNHEVDGYAMRISASFAPSIKQQIGELQKTLLEGLLAVLVIGSIVIAVRASVVTVLSMVTVIFATLGLLELIGYSLNTITLFALILSLSLIVDDTIIMVEAIDAQRKKKTDPTEIVRTAIKKVGKAMIAATTTAALSFAPLLFVGGILGTFVRAIPITIMSALVISLIVALIIIPLYARYLLLGKKHLGKHTEREIAASFEAAIARGISRPMLWAQHSKKKLYFVCTFAVLVSFLFIGAGGYLFQKVTFNIFPSSKDTNQISVTLQFPNGTTIADAETITDRAVTKIGNELGDSFVHAANYGMATTQKAQLFVDLTDYNSRDKTAPQLINDIKQSFVGFEGAQVTAQSIDAGPPPADFTVRINAEKNRDAAVKLAEDITAYLGKADIKRVDGSKIKFENIRVDNADAFTRVNANAYIGVTAAYVDDDTTALVTATKASVEKAFPASRIASYGLPESALQFSFGQEDDNQDSFKTMALAFPAILVVIYIVLATQFRSLMQPLLIFMAIPFSLFGITLGLWLTDNAFSFFAMLGFFALIGLSIKNTILLTDYANQSRRRGMNPVDAAHAALAERFRPLIATSLTAVVSLIPLALSSPFWQGLAVVLMFGLSSSTFLVVTVFPYYYLIGEYLRGVWRRQVTHKVKMYLKRKVLAWAD